jgi:hypothetical protein
VACAFANAHADDSLRIRYFPADSYGTAPSERGEIFIERASPYAGRNANQDADTFFRQIRSVVEAAGPPLSWELMGEHHAGRVRVEILLGTTKYFLSADFGENGLDTSDAKSPADTRHAAALREILRLTAERVNTRLR